MRMEKIDLQSEVLKVKRDIDWLTLLKDLKKVWICELQEDSYSPDYLFTQVQKGKKRVANGIYLDPDYQRKFRFSDQKASSIIESLLVKIPIPTIYLASENVLDEDTGNYTPVRRVIDGQHRIKSITRFMDNEYSLKKLELLKPLEGLKYKDFPPTLKAYFDSQTKLVMATIDVNDNKHLELEVFSRFNEETNPLSKQELYNAVYNSHYSRIVKNELPNYVKSNEFMWKQFNFSSAIIEKSMHLYQLYIIPAYYRLEDFKKSKTPTYIQEYMKRNYYLTEVAARQRFEEDIILYNEFFSFIENIAKENDIQYMFSKNILSPKTKDVPSRHRYLVSILIQLVYIYRELKKSDLFYLINDYKKFYDTLKEGFEVSNFGDFGGNSSTDYTYQSEALKGVMKVINDKYSKEIILSHYLINNKDVKEITDSLYGLIFKTAHMSQEEIKESYEYVLDLIKEQVKVLEEVDLNATCEITGDITENHVIEDIEKYCQKTKEIQIKKLEIILEFFGLYPEVKIKMIENIKKYINENLDQNYEY